MIPFKELHEILKHGDIVTVKGVHNIYDAVFNKWVHCKWKNKNDSYEECIICKGYMTITDSKNNIQYLCTGVGSGYSNVSKIVKNKNIIQPLEDLLFKI